MSQIIRIVAAVVDTRNLTLYKADGESIVIPQGDARVRRIVDVSTGPLTTQGWADVDIATPADVNSYAEFQDQSNGVVKFFRIAKDKLKQLLALGLVEEEPFTDDAPVAPVTLGIVNPAQPGTFTQPEASEAKELPAIPAGVRTMQAAVDEIMAHAVPATSPDFHERSVDRQADMVDENGATHGDHTSTDAPDTIVAVVGDKVIPGMEKIKNQFGRAANLGSTVGVENFLKRLGTVIEKRSHSVEDLLKFMERGDLPIADDGSILIYKVLNRRNPELYVDCHTSKVEQFVGAYVCMDEKLVDHNRNNECSNGLHVARRGYISGFSGNVCVMAKLAPEDVIAVPAYDANKMRVCGYHIIKELSPEQHSLLKANKPITDDAEGRRLLADALAGKHIGKTHEVRITRQQGGGVETKKLNSAPVEVKVPVPAQPAQPAPAVPKEAVALPDSLKEDKDVPINPVDVVKGVEQVSRKDQAAKLYEEWGYAIEGDENGVNQERIVAAEAALRAFKKTAKVGWDKLGIPVDKNGQPKPPRFKSTKSSPKAPAKAVVSTASEGSPRDRIHKLLAIGVKTAKIAQQIIDIKKASKKSWEALGLQQITVDHIFKTAKGE